MEELIGMITKHLKKGERVKIAGLGVLQVRLPHWPQSCDWRANPDQGQQENRLPRHQRAQDGDLTARRPWPFERSSWPRSRRELAARDGFRAKETSAIDRAMILAVVSGHESAAVQA